MTLTLGNLPPDLQSAIADRLADRSQAVDLCVLGTGTTAPRPFLEVTGAEWATQMDTLRDACLLAGSVAREAIAQGRGARLVFITQPPSIRAVPGATVSGVAGAFLTTMAQVAGIELAAQDVTCNVVVAGWMAEGAPASMVSSIPAGRFAAPDEIAGAIEFLVSPIASYINGATLVIDGGFAISKVGGGSPLLR